MGILIELAAQMSPAGDMLVEDIPVELAVQIFFGTKIVRASELAILTRAGAEIGVASTKAFTTQLAALMLLSGKLAEINNRADFKREALDAAQQYKC